MHHIIFDMDGVLADSWKDGNECLLKLHFFADTMVGTIRKQIEYALQVPDHARGSGMTEDEFRTRVTRVHEFGVCLASRKVPLFDAFIDEIRRIPETKVAVVSSNAGIFVQKIAKEIGLPFTHVLAFEDSGSKAEKIETICNDWEIPVTQARYITDTLGDVYELVTIMPRKHIFGCAWGYLGYEVLRKELSEAQILREPKDIHRVLTSV